MYLCRTLACGRVPPSIQEEYVKGLDVDNFKFGIYRIIWGLHSACVHARK